MNKSFPILVLSFIEIPVLPHIVPFNIYQKLKNSKILRLFSSVFAELKKPITFAART